MGIFENNLSSKINFNLKTSDNINIDSNIVSKKTPIKLFEISWKTYKCINTDHFYIVVFDNFY